MYKAIIFALLFASFAHAQTKPAAAGKKPADKKSKAIAKKDSLDALQKDSAKFAAEDAKVPQEFTVYTKKPRSKAERMKLCINLVSGGKVLNYCMNDSLCKDPETSKILFEERKGDTLYVLVLVDAFTKVDPGNDDGRCDAGKETKLVFARWNTKTNQAKWKQKNISSCRRGITNMTREPIAGWDKSAPLVISYHRATSFYELKFDPAQFELGFQSVGNSESESK